MKLITTEQHSKLLENGQEGQSDPEFDPVPVVKIFNPIGSATWLITEIDPNDNDRAFGLCDLGLGMPELGYISITELEQIRVGPNMRLERDMYWNPKKKLSEYAESARNAGSITT